MQKTEIIKLDEMIEGFARSVCMLGKGGQGLFCVPPELAYKNKEGSEFQNQTFYFYIKLVEVLPRRTLSTELKLSDPQFSSLVFAKTTVTESIDILGKPAAEKKSWSNANLGFMCVRTFRTILSYDSKGAEIIFCSFNKDRKNRKILSHITLNSMSKLKINDSLVLNISDKSAVKELFGDVGDAWGIDSDKKELYWYYKLKFAGQDVNALFTFTDKGILQRLEIFQNK